MNFVTNIPASGHTVRFHVSFYGILLSDDLLVTRMQIGDIIFKIGVT